MMLCKRNLVHAKLLSDFPLPVQCSLHALALGSDESQFHDQKHNLSIPLTLCCLPTTTVHAQLGFQLCYFGLKCSMHVLPEQTGSLPS